jgi:hypothetical protein
MLQIVLLAGKIAFLLILYLFIYRVIRSATRELRTTATVADGQQLAVQAGASASRATGANVAAPGPKGTGVWALVVQKSPSVAAGTTFSLPLGAHAMAGRSSEMDIQLEDTFVSSKHALFETTTTGLQVEDLRSTNGTQVNGADISDPVALQVGDRVEVGDTVFQVVVR